MPVQVTGMLADEVCGCGPKRKHRLAPPGQDRLGINDIHSLNCAHGACELVTNLIQELSDTNPKMFEADHLWIQRINHSNFMSSER